MSAVDTPLQPMGGMEPIDTKHQNGYGSDHGSGSRSPLASFGFLGKITGEKKTTRDGQTPKRRGPKPDSKPALTRRQELNRQAQRTHRERKEMYIKALEQEVIRLRDTTATSIRERDLIIEENRRLKELLAAHGISIDGIQSPTINYGPSSSTYGGSHSGASTGYNANSASTGYTSPSTQSQLPSPGTAGQQQIRGNVPQNGGASGGVSGNGNGIGQASGLDYDAIGIDFVLTLERPCMDHMQMLLTRSHTGPVDSISGHALMASCPPESHIENHADTPYPLQMPEGIAMPDLLKLLDLSNRLPLEGEITPVMAWARVLSHVRFGDFERGDFERVKGELLGKVRCYGFGAVLEEFEVHDALTNVLAGKPGAADIDFGFSGL